MARSKITQIRYKSFMWLIVGIGFLYLYFIFKIAKVFALIGVVAMFFSMFMYSRAGHFATKAREIECPACGKLTKVVSRADACSYCKVALIDEGRGVYKAVNNDKNKKKKKQAMST
ncbi:DUF2614 family zinc ribbon-containing protein [Desulfuribacillus alkaliarsenatis]|uniref:Uncharacterized protein n=1 Tax=Desulfuribacillus alkaliarsenatis TaxID=766136 RepID=A0A1E5G1S9_9FIRM|nr:DUF2614 family zinc ribbon-containing protein [Desulfuribacillus alkaliarsenatis]OEF96479.1 hypothetical protein BHF68_07425 [Desulfuribacillus alkaliarsenatis]